MSAATPAPSNPPSPPSSPLNDGTLLQLEAEQDKPSEVEQMILEYLRKRGHKNAEQALRDALNLPPNEQAEDIGAEAPEPVQTTVSDEELRKHLVPFWEKKEGSGDNALSDGDIAMQSLLTGGVTASSVTKLLESIGPGGADEILSLDPTDRHEGFRDLEGWVDGSLDMYRVRAKTMCRVDVYVHSTIAGIQTDFIPNLLPFLPGPHSTRL